MQKYGVALTEYLSFTVLSFNCFSLCKWLLWPSLDLSRAPLNHLVPSSIPSCTGFGWDGVNFPHSSWYGAMFWICDQNSVHTLFWLLLNSAYSVKAFSVSHTVLQWSRQAVDKRLGGDTAGTADSSWPGGYPMPYDIMLSNRNWTKGGEKGWQL